jgi:CheY-like chemotaxis protein
MARDQESVKHNTADTAGTAAKPAERPADRKSVLVVEDEPFVAMLIMDVLDELGYGAVHAADAAAGLEALRADGRIDLLITDVGLPGGMNGRQLADAARESRPTLKVLFVTGYAAHGVLAGAVLADGMEVLSKPFSEPMLMERITALLG